MSEEKEEIKNFELNKDDAVKVFQVLAQMKVLLNGVEVRGKANMDSISSSINGIDMISNMLGEEFQKQFPELVQRQKQ